MISMEQKIPLSYEIVNPIESLFSHDHKSGLLHKTIGKLTSFYINLIYAIMFFRYLFKSTERNMGIKVKFINPPSKDTISYINHLEKST
jgi:hypothetical protein